MNILFSSFMHLSWVWWYIDTFFGRVAVNFEKIEIEKIIPGLKMPISLKCLFLFDKVTAGKLVMGNNGE